MFVVDTNVLVHAADQDSEFHPKCLARIRDWRIQATPWHLTWGIVYEFLRVVTHPRVFRNPWKSDDAWAFIDALLASSSLSILAHGEYHPRLLKELIHEIQGMRGNLLHDAHIVTLMREHGIRVIYTRDTDFHRFPGLDVRDPTA